LSAKQTIFVTAGDPEYTLPVTVTEVTGKDISADVVALGLSTSKTLPPTVWTPPDVDHSTAVNVRVVQVLVGTSLSPTPGTYFVWVQVTDTPEKPPRFTGLQLTVI
jgi:hypothetical protein